MGYGSFRDSDYSSRVSNRAATGTPTFVYDSAVKAGKASGVHDSLNIKNKIREARDSAEHPESVPIGVIFDVTGSMSSVPAAMQKKLPELMGLLLRKGYVKDPQILFGAVGDYYSDNVPLQIGQFESGIEMDDNITHIYLEGNGGGTRHESYQNALYFFAHRTATDAWDKRKAKGYLFVVGDELPYAKSTREELQSLVDEKVERDFTVEEIVQVAQEKWNVFYILPKGTSYYDRPDHKEAWQKLLGPEHVLMLEDPDAVCELVGMTIGLMEGAVPGDAIPDALKDVGATARTASVVSTALDPLAKTAIVRAGAASGALAEAKGPSTANERL